MPETTDAGVQETPTPQSCCCAPGCSGPAAQCLLRRLLDDAVAHRSVDAGRSIAAPDPTRRCVMSGGDNRRRTCAEEMISVRSASDHRSVDALARRAALLDATTAALQRIALSPTYGPSVLGRVSFGGLDIAWRLGDERRGRPDWGPDDGRGGPWAGVPARPRPRPPRRPGCLALAIPSQES